MQCLTDSAHGGTFVSWQILPNTTGSSSESKMTDSSAKIFLYIVSISLSKISLLLL